MRQKSIVLSILILLAVVLFSINVLASTCSNTWLDCSWTGQYYSCGETVSCALNYCNFYVISPKNSYQNIRATAKRPDGSTYTPTTTYNCDYCWTNLDYSKYDCRVYNNIPKADALTIKGVTDVNHYLSITPGKSECSDECDPNNFLRRCSDNKVVDCRQDGDGDPCFEPFAFQDCKNLGSNYFCKETSTGALCYTCTSHSYKGCYNNDIYWFNSCNKAEEIYQDCGESGYVGSNYCYNNDVYRDYVNKGCSGSSCSSSTEKRLQQDCPYSCTNGVCSSCAKDCSPKTEYKYTCESTKTYKKQARDYSQKCTGGCDIGEWYDVQAGISCQSGYVCDSTISYPNVPCKKEDVLLKGSVVNMENNPITDATIYADKECDGSYEYSIKTDSYGYYSMNIPSGNYKVKFVSPCYGTYPIYGNNCITVDKDQYIRHEIRMYVDGYYKKSDGTPISDADVYFDKDKDGTWDYSAKTNLNGYFVVQIPQNHNYKIKITKSGYNDYLSEFLFSQCQNKNLGIMNPSSQTPIPPTPPLVTPPTPPTIQCTQDSNCQTDLWTGSPYCSNNDVYQTWRDYSCQSSQCKYSDAAKMKQDCATGENCVDGGCKALIPKGNGNKLVIFYTNDDYSSAIKIKNKLAGNFDAIELFLVNSGTDPFTANNYVDYHVIVLGGPLSNPLADNELDFIEENSILKTAYFQEYEGNIGLVVEYMQEYGLEKSVSKFLESDESGFVIIRKTILGKSNAHIAGIKSIGTSKAVDKFLEEYTKDFISGNKDILEIVSEPKPYISVRDEVIENNIYTLVIVRNIGIDPEEITIESDMTDKLFELFFGNDENKIQNIDTNFYTSLGNVITDVNANNYIDPCLINADQPSTCTEIQSCENNPNYKSLIEVDVPIHYDETLLPYAFIIFTPDPVSLRADPSKKICVQKDCCSGGNAKIKFYTDYIDNTNDYFMAVFPKHDIAGAKATLIDKKSNDKKYTSSWTGGRDFGRDIFWIGVDVALFKAGTIAKYAGKFVKTEKVADVLSKIKSSYILRLFSKVGAKTSPYLDDVGKGLVHPKRQILIDKLQKFSTAEQKIIKGYLAKVKDPSKWVPDEIISKSYERVAIDDAVKKLRPLYTEISENSKLSVLRTPKMLENTPDAFLYSGKNMVGMMEVKKGIFSGVYKSQLIGEMKSMITVLRLSPLEESTKPYKILLYGKSFSDDMPKVLDEVYDEVWRTQSIGLKKLGVSSKEVFKQKFTFEKVLIDSRMSNSAKSYTDDIINAVEGSSKTNYFLPDNIPLPVHFINLVLNPPKTPTTPSTPTTPPQPATPSIPTLKILDGFQDNSVNSSLWSGTNIEETGKQLQSSGSYSQSPPQALIEELIPLNGDFSSIVFKGSVGHYAGGSGRGRDIVHEGILEFIGQKSTKQIALNTWNVPFERQGCNENNIPHPDTFDYCKSGYCSFCWMSINTTITRDGNNLNIKLLQGSTSTISLDEIGQPFKMRFISKMSGNVNGGVNQIKLNYFEVK